MAATTEVEICNSALVKCGVERITALADSTERARLCNEQYGKVRDALLRSHPWNFLITRASLTADATAPDWGFTYRYPLPADYLRILEVETSDIDWQREGQYILTDSSECKIRYIAKVTDVTKYDATFLEALALALAVDMCMSLTSSNTLREKLREDYERELARARSYDAQEGFPRQIEVTDWLVARY